MIDRIAKKLSQPNKASLSSENAITRRSMVSRMLSTSAGVLVAGSAASTITLKADAQIEDPCDTCYRVYGCPDFVTAYYCDARGRGRKCCSCGEDIIPYVCATICVDWPVTCYRSAP